MLLKTTTMTSYLTALAVLVLLGTFASPAIAQSGSGTTTRYWYVYISLLPFLLTHPGIVASLPAPGPCPASHRQSRLATSLINL